MEQTQYKAAADCGMEDVMMHEYMIKTSHSYGDINR